MNLEDPRFCKVLVTLTGKKRHATIAAIISIRKTTYSISIDLIHEA